MPETDVAAFRDPTRLTVLARVGLAGLMVATVATMVSDVLEYRLLSDFAEGVYASRTEIEAAADANDLRQLYIWGAWMGIFVLGGIVNLIWIYRAHQNVRALGAKHIQFSPGWAVGWFFVPILNLWKPFQAMKQLWYASVNPAGWIGGDAPTLLVLWWTLWILAGVMGNVSNHLLRKAEELDDFMNADIVNLAGAIITLALAAVFLTMINRIYAMQMEHFGKAGNS